MFQLSRDLNKNMKEFKELFQNDDVIIMREFENQYDPALRCFLICADGMVNSELINDGIIRPLLLYNKPLDNKNLINEITKKIVFVNSIEETDDVEKLFNAIMSGSAVILVDKCNAGLIMDVKGFDKRAIAEPGNEKTLIGPKEGFTENILSNISMIRRKIKSDQLKFEFSSFGDITQTKACICYMDDIVDKKVLEELKTRLSKFDFDSALDTNYLAEYICDSPKSIFDTTSVTERPDTAAGKLLEGRICLILDGTPDVLTVPFMFLEIFQSSDDYYKNHYLAAISRIFRILGFIITITLPALYLAIITYHQEMIPSNMLFAIASARKDVPFPTVFELILLLVAFDILQEAGVRMPASIGQTLSIVGALVLGQASVEAKLASAPLVIIVATTGTVSLLVPQMRGAKIACRYLLIALAGCMGFYGVVFGMIVILTHLCSLRSFGVGYLDYFSPNNFQEAKDTVIRARWPLMKYRPRGISKNNNYRKKRV